MRTFTIQPAGVNVASLAHFCRVLAVPGVALKLTRYEIAGQPKPHRCLESVLLVKQLDKSSVIVSDITTNNPLWKLPLLVAANWSFDGNRATYYADINTPNSTILTFEIYEIETTTTEQETN